MTDLATPPAADLDMMGTYYRVPVSDIGEDGEIVALGHHDPRRALAAFQRHAREMWGQDLFADEHHRPPLDEALKRVTHRWVTKHGGGGDWWLERADASTPGALPVTWWTPE